ncbi:MAG: hypothetical protein ACREQ4_16805 [Candidatus Binataceae bacterium]
MGNIILLPQTNWPVVPPGTDPKLAKYINDQLSLIARAYNGLLLQLGFASTNPQGGINLDTQVIDGATYGRVKQAALTTGQPDLSKAGVIGKSQANIADDPTTGRSAMLDFDYPDFSAATWVNIGTWVFNRIPSSITFEFIAGPGYNTANNSQGFALLTLRSSNNISGAPNLTGATFLHFGNNYITPQIKIAATGGSTSQSNNSWDIHVEFDQFCGGHMLVRKRQGDSFTPSMATAADPGPASSTVVVATGSVLHDHTGKIHQAQQIGGVAKTALVMSDLHDRVSATIGGSGNTGMDNVDDGATFKRLAGVSASNLATSGSYTGQSVGTAAIANQAVGTGQIANQAINTGQIANNAVTATQVAAGTIGGTNSLENTGTVSVSPYNTWVDLDGGITVTINESTDVIRCILTIIAGRVTNANAADELQYRVIRTDTGAVVFGPFSNGITAMQNANQSSAALGASLMNLATSGFAAGNYTFQPQMLSDNGSGSGKLAITITDSIFEVQVKK